MIVHIGTKITATFGRVNENGDFANPTPLEFTLPALTEEAVAVLLSEMLESRDKLRAALVDYEAKAVAPAAKPEQ